MPLKLANIPQIEQQAGAVTDNALDQQALLKVEAARDDLNTIAVNGAQPAPAWLKANWGNNGVNPPVANPSTVDGTSAIANVAQNIVMLVNAKPELATDQTIVDALKAAVFLSSFTTNQRTEENLAVSAHIQGNELAYMNTMWLGLDKAAKDTTLQDQKGQQYHWMISSQHAGRKSPPPSNSAKNRLGHNIQEKAAQEEPYRV